MGLQGHTSDIQLLHNKAWFGPSYHLKKFRREVFPHPVQKKSITTQRFLLLVYGGYYIYCIYKETLNNNQLNDQNTMEQNAIFETYCNQTTSKIRTSQAKLLQLIRQHMFTPNPHFNI